MNNFETLIANLDLSLFERISSQSTEMDKASLLACQSAVRDRLDTYNYLEIGSYLGGSIQPHLLDPKCKRIYSIDKRPVVQPDARGYDWQYRNNSTERMMSMLSEVATDTRKIKTLDGDTRNLDPKLIDQSVQLCFIDGEHTDESVGADFRFCLTGIDTDAAIVFHDSHIIYNGIATALEYLEKKGIKFRAYVLPHTVFVVEIGEFPLHRHRAVEKMLLENRHSYLFALQDNDHFRRFANRFPFGLLRKVMLKVRGGNVSE